MARKTSKKKPTKKKDFVGDANKRMGRIDDALNAMDKATARLITPRQVAEMLFISPRTLARWCIAFEQSLSETASRRGRKRFFTSADIQQLQKAQTMLNEGLTIEATAQQLPVITPEEEQQTALVLAPEHAYQLGQLVTQAEGLVQEVNRLRERGRTLEQEKEDLQYRIDRVERTVEWLKRPIWKRIFSPPDEWSRMDERIRTVRQEQRSESRTLENWGGVQQEQDTNEEDDNPTDTDT